jgi:hypothetical protein
VIGAFQDFEKEYGYNENKDRGVVKSNNGINHLCLAFSCT